MTLSHRPVRPQHFTIVDAPTLAGQVHTQVGDGLNGDAACAGLFASEQNHRRRHGNGCDTPVVLGGNGFHQPNHARFRRGIRPLLGYAAVSEPEIEAGIAILAKALR